ncbi:MAG TPA: hypothetical protein VMT11_10830 [Myxococcaceae bacterium]|nr:hypothetical protein [Myxococcaceae bacterium]
MRPGSHLLALLLALSGCSRSPSPTQLAPPPTVSSSPPEGARSQEAVAAARRSAGNSPPSAVTAPRPGVDGGTPQPVRAKIEPLTRFQIVPVGEAAVAPARATLDALRVRYVAYGFDLGPVLPMPSPRPRTCDELLTSRVAARGTIFVVPGTLPCSAPFGAVNSVLKAGLVLLAPLGPSGRVAERRLTALLGSMVGELIGLSMPCTDGVSCCALRKAKDVRTLDTQAAAPCPAHASELDRIREANGMQ